MSHLVLADRGKDFFFLDIKSTAILQDKEKSQATHIFTFHRQFQLKGADSVHDVQIRNL